MRLKPLVVPSRSRKLLPRLVTVAPADTVESIISGVGVGGGGAGGTTGGGATAANCAWAGNAATTPSIGPTTRQRKTVRASWRLLRVLPARKGRHGQRMWSNSRNRRPLK